MVRASEEKNGKKQVKWGSQMTHLKNNYKHNYLNINHSEVTTNSTIADVLLGILIDAADPWGKVERKDFNAIVARFFRIDKRLIDQFILDNLRKGHIELRNQNLVITRKAVEKKW